MLDSDFLDNCAIGVMTGIVSSIQTDEHYVRVKRIAEASGKTVTDWIADEAFKQAEAMRNRRDQHRYGNLRK